MSRGVQSQQLVQVGRVLRGQGSFEQAVIQGFCRLQTDWTWHTGSMITADEASRSCAQSSTESTLAFRRLLARRDRCPA